MIREAINELKKYTLGKKNIEKVEISVLQLNRVIKALEQEPTKTGHWIKSRDCYGNYHFTCSECGNDIATQYSDNWEDKYCSECGCRMVEPQKSEEISDRNKKMWEEIFKADRSDKECTKKI